MLNDPVLFEKYEDFTLRRLLSLDPDTRWCPAPDCGYVETSISGRARERGNREKEALIFDRLAIISRQRIF